MNILFLTLLDFSTLDESGIYTDLMRQFVKDNHKVCIISPTEKRKQQPTRLIDNDNYKILKLQIGNTQKTNLIEKGISTLTLESKFKRGIKKYFSDMKYDLVIYTTPPITLQKAIEYLKNRDNATTYLLLKDIFPQNAVDLGMVKKTGIKGLLYGYFKSKEKKLYELSDYIGCMSQANVDFLLKQNPEILPNTVEVCPNSIEPLTIEKDEQKVKKIKNKYKIPLDCTVFIYGGNLGKPQGIDFLIECLKFNKENNQVYFVIAGSGTEFNRLKTFLNTEKLTNAQLFAQLPKEDYEVLANSCDVGLIFLDKRFTIPNFPSRLLSYMQASMPVLAATDINTDIGKVIEKGGFGLWCESSDVEQFHKRVDRLCDKNIRKQMGVNARRYLEDNYTAKHSYEIIMSHFNYMKRGKSMFKDKTLLITGGTGSFGNAVMQRFLDTGIKEIRIFSRDEKKQDDMRKQYKNDKLKFYIGDVRDLASVKNAMHGVDYIFHAAALKQVPSCEFFPLEAVNTNVLGTDNVLTAAIEYGVKKVICLSTDKAAYPINAMGISKAMMEKVFVAKSKKVLPERTLITGTRYGNVMASRGSVIPLFIEQIKNGDPLTVTDPSMTRFLMSLEEAVELVIFAFQNAEAGDIMVQKSPSSTIGDLAQAVKELFNADNEIKIIGTRHGEKKYETLLTKEEYVKAEDLGGFFRVPADQRDLNYDKYFADGDQKLTTVAEYNSDNTQILNIEQIKEKLLELDYVQNELKEWNTKNHVMN